MLLSVVVPCYNEENNLRPLCAACREALEGVAEYELVFVNDGSTDGTWQQLQAPLLFDVEGDGFLYKMVRIIVGRLLAVGSGMLAPEAMAGFLDGSERRNIPPAPGRGLMLMAVHYGSTISADFS